MYQRTNSRLKVYAPMKRSTKRMKRNRIKPSLKPMKKKRAPPALIKAERIARRRDDCTCQFPGCGKRYKNIDVHHIAKRSQRPDLRFDSDNLVCLCREHHDWTDLNHDEAVRMGLLSVESYELAKKQEREAA